MDTATKRPVAASASRRPVRAGSRVTRRGPDRLSVMLLGLAAFLAILALLAGQLRGNATHGYATRAVVLRRIYLTRVIDSGPGPISGPAVSQSVSSSGGYAPPAQLTTHTS